jgi:hypothetical protein
MRRLAVLVALLGPSAVPLLGAASEAAADLPAPSAELLASRARSAKQPSMHPPVVLRDEKGVPVLTSGGPVSAARTCDGCHDVTWIKDHDRHATMLGAEHDRDLAIAARGNCFLCHVRHADNRARLSAIEKERRDWVETATLASTGLVSSEGDGWRWRKEGFAVDGSVAAATLDLARPASRPCGFCHGTVYEDVAPMTLAPDPRMRMTDLQGLVFSGQRISDSAVNLAGKAALYGPWDVHAERLLTCASCHFSPNHPAYAHATSGPAHLEFDARRVSISEFLRRPDHRLAKGVVGEGGHDGGIRRCEVCHDAPGTHRFLPRAERHLAALLCESCHVPAAHAPARQETDWTMLTVARQARVVYRGGAVDGFVTGFRPILLPRLQGDGKGKLGPNNLVTTYAWVEKGSGEPEPVSRELLEKAFFVDGAHRPELVWALDRDGDGKLREDELPLDSQAKVDLARALLVAAGAKAPELSGVITRYELHHGVSPGRYAMRECSGCHTAGSRLSEPMLVAGSAPFGVTPVLAAQAGVEAAGALVRDGQGRVWFQANLAGLHVFGHTRSRLLDGLGLLMVVGAFAGAGAHALLRIRSARRRGKEAS